MKKSTVLLTKILRIIGTIAALLYVLFLIGEGVPLFSDVTFADSSVYLLFLIFIVGYYFLWKNELISGIILIAWYAIQWMLVFWVWIDGGLTLILGLPLGIFGIIVLVFGIHKRSFSEAN